MEQPLFLPPELWQGIIGYSSRDDLTSLALANSFFASFCADVLFRSVTITGWELTKLVRRTEGLSSPNISSRIQTLELRVTRHHPLQDTAIEEVWVASISTALLPAIGKMINLREYVHGERYGPGDYPFSEMLAASLSALPHLTCFRLCDRKCGVLRTAIIPHLTEIAIKSQTFLARDGGEEGPYIFLSHSHASLRKVSCNVGKGSREAVAADYNRFSTLLRSAPRLESLVTLLFNVHKPSTTIHTSRTRWSGDEWEAVQQWMTGLRKELTPLPNLRRLQLNLVSNGTLPKDWAILFRTFILGRHLEVLRIGTWMAPAESLPDEVTILDALDDPRALVELRLPLHRHKDFVEAIATIARKAPNLRKLELWHSTNLTRQGGSKLELKQKALLLAQELLLFPNLQWLSMAEPMPSAEDMVSYARVLGEAASKLCRVTFCTGYECNLIRDVNGTIKDVVDVSNPSQLVLSNDLWE